MKYIITAYSEYIILKIKKIFNTQNYLTKLIITPRKISSECGMSIEIVSGNHENLINILTQNKIEFDYIYKYDNGEYKKIGRKNNDN